MAVSTAVFGSSKTTLRLPFFCNGSPAPAIDGGVRCAVACT